MGYIGLVNKYLAENQPWIIAKDPALRPRLAASCSRPRRPSAARATSSFRSCPGRSNGSGAFSAKHKSPRRSSGRSWISAVSGPAGRSGCRRRSSRGWRSRISWARSPARAAPARGPNRRRRERRTWTRSPTKNSRGWTSGGPDHRSGARARATKILKLRIDLAPSSVRWWPGSPRPTRRGPRRKEAHRHRQPQAGRHPGHRVPGHAPGRDHGRQQGPHPLLRPDIPAGAIVK